MKKITKFFLSVFGGCLIGSTIADVFIINFNTIMASEALYKIFLALFAAFILIKFNEKEKFEENKEIVEKTDKEQIASNEV